MGACACLVSIGRRASLGVLVAVLGLGVGGCLQTEDQRQSELRKRADEILPAGAGIRALDYGDCVELASSPSCIYVIFELPERDSYRRAALVWTSAENNGWQVTTRYDQAPGGWSVRLKRDNFEAIATLFRHEVYEGCSGELDAESHQYCFNTLHLTRY